MKKLIKRLLTLLIVFALLFAACLVPSSAQSDAYSEAKTLINGIVDYNLSVTGSASLSQWINGAMTKSPNTNEWYALALSQYGGYDFSAYKTALTNYLSNNNVASASSRQKYSLVLVSVKSGDKFIYDTLNNSIGKQGIMSYVFGLHLLNNGYTSEETSVSEVKDKLLSLRRSDGGWSVTGSYGDVDATAMVIQALAPYKSEAKIKSAIDNALGFLSSRQKEDGTFASYGVYNAESTAQVLTALSSLGIDFANDTRFIKNGNTVLDGIKIFKLSNGSFTHKEGNSTDTSATVQIFYSLVSYVRMCEGRTAFYILDNRNPSAMSAYKSKETKSETDPTVPAALNTGSENADGEKTAETVKENNEEAVKEGETYEETPDKTDGQIAIDSQKDGNSIFKSYKFYAAAIVLLLAIAVCGVMLILKKRNIRNYIFVAAVAVLLIAAVLLTNIQSANGFYTSNSSVTGSIGEVTLTIRCNNIESIKDRIILENEAVEIKENACVYDALLSATAKNKIQLETSGSDTSVYVKGIDNLYEFDYGDLSGWMYKVNGVSPSVGCSEYKLSVGDEVVWYYTANMGKDEEE